MLESILMATGGGIVLGLAASWLLYSIGRISGVSGIAGGLLQRWNTDSMWRVSFLLGLVAGGVLLAQLYPTSIEAPTARSLPTIAIAGLLVGLGTQRGSGCTSGHGICGITRLSPRSLVATGTFMAAGMLTATLLVKLFGLTA